MYYFIKTRDQENHFDVSDVQLKTQSDITIDDLLDTFERFLLACSFVFKGHVRIVEDEEE